MNKLLSIVIVTYNSEHLLFECLNSIFQYNDIGNSLEIVVVDNASKSQIFLGEQIRKIYTNKVTFIANEKNCGYGHGNNLGANFISAPIFVVMNPDVRLVSPIFKQIIYQFEINQSLGLMGVNFVDKSRALYYKPEYDNIFTMLFMNLLIPLNLYKLEKMFFSGSFLVLRKNVFLMINGFDKNIFLYFEEADISNRILKSGYQIMLSRQIAVLHLTHNRSPDHYLIEIQCNSLEYYAKKYQINIIKYYKQLIIMFSIKYFFALILNNSNKMQLFSLWASICKKRIKSI